MSRLAVITGGSSGLGLAMAVELGGQGHRILLIARGRERLDAAVAQLAAQGIEAEAHVADVTDETAIRRVTEHIRVTYGRVDFLALNAGVVSTGLLRDYASVSDMQRDVTVNLLGTMLCAQLFLPLLGPASRLLMISSGFGLMGAAGYAPYAAAKAGIINFGEALRRECLDTGPQVYVACPGDIETPQHTEELRSMPAWMRGSSPRRGATAEDTARKILRQCRGRRKFLILSGGDVLLLMFVSRLIPRTWREAILDRAFPRPPVPPAAKRGSQAAHQV